MGNVTIYLPDPLHQQVRDARLNVSQVCQQALREALTDDVVKAALARSQQTSDPVERTFGCTPTRHLGPIERLGEYAKRCQACGHTL